MRFQSKKTAMLKCFMIFPEPKNNDKARNEIIKSEETKRHTNMGIWLSW